MVYVKRTARILLTGGIIASMGLVTKPVAGAQSSKLNPAERQQWQTDPFGAAVWGSIKGTSDLLRGMDGGARSIASYYASVDPNAAFPGSFGKLDACVKRIVGPYAPQMVRENIAFGCLVANRELKDQILAEVSSFH